MGKSSAPILFGLTLHRSAGLADRVGAADGHLLLDGSGPQHLQRLVGAGFELVLWCCGSFVVVERLLAQHAAVGIEQRSVMPRAPPSFRSQTSRRGT